MLDMDFACGFKHPNMLMGVNLSPHTSVLAFTRRGQGFNCSRDASGSYNYRSKPPKWKWKGVGFCCHVAMNQAFCKNLNCLCRPSSPLILSNASLYWPRKSLKRTGWLHCQGDDSLACVDGSSPNLEAKEGFREGHSEAEYGSNGELNGSVSDQKTASDLEDLKEVVRKSLKDLELARLNSTMLEGKAQKISELAIALKDEAIIACNDVTLAVSAVQEIMNEEENANEAVQKAAATLSVAEAKLKLAMQTLQSTKKEEKSINFSQQTGDDRVLVLVQEEIEECKATLANSEFNIGQIQKKKTELHREVDRLSIVAEKAQLDAIKADEDVANIMLLAEKAVAHELECIQCVNDAVIALQIAENAISTFDTLDKQVSSSQSQVTNKGSRTAVDLDQGIVYSVRESDEHFLASSNQLSSSIVTQSIRELKHSDAQDAQEECYQSADSHVEVENEIEKSKNMLMAKKLDQQKDSKKSGSFPLIGPKALIKKSSRFFSASFFSFTEDGKRFTPASVYHGIITTTRKEAPKLILCLVLIGTGAVFFTKKAEKTSQLLQPDVVIGIEEFTSTVKPVVQEIKHLPKRLKKIIEGLSLQEVNEEEASLFDMLWLLLASVIFVPIFQKIPGGSPVLGFLAAGTLIGPYGLSIIRHVHGTKAIAEFGVVFLLFNIGLELSVERLRSMRKYVFGLGSAQVLVTAIAVGLVAHFLTGLPGPSAIVIGNGLALSSTAVVLQVLQERGENTSRHGRATFSVLLFQDLAVVVLLILIPLISPNSSNRGDGFLAITKALGLAAIKAVVAITAIIAGGRLFLRPFYKQIAENQNAEIFSATTLLVILGTSLLTARAGLSMALGAFLAGLLLAETEFSLQVESDIAPYRGLLLGLFFMTVGMSIDPKLLFSNYPIISGSLCLLIAGKTILVALMGRVFGISSIAAVRVGLLLAPGGEFAFVAFGDAVNQGIMSPQLSSLLFLVVGLSMALTPWLAAGGQWLTSRFEQHNVRNLLPVESETDDLHDHIIICGFGRVGQIIAQLLSERLIPFVALDIRSDRVALGRALDLPVFFGDAGSREVLHKVGADRACATAITLDSPGANYRTVWALSNFFPNVKTFVIAHDIDHGINLEKAGASAVVPEMLEPSLQLASAVLAQAKLPMSEIATTIDEFRARHLSELTELCRSSGGSLGYGFSSVMSKPKGQASDSEDKDVAEGTVAI